MEDRPLTLISSLTLSACFLAALVLPVAENFLHFAPNMTLSEKRVLQKYPRFEWNPKALLSYPSAFETAFNDHFGLRDRKPERSFVGCICLPRPKSRWAGKVGYI
jgi:hypothetical protein